MRLGEKIYDLRRRSGLSQEQMAEQLEVSRQAVSKWESGRSTPDADKLVAISKLFGVTTDYLLLESSVEKSIQETPAEPLSKRVGIPRKTAGKERFSVSRGRAPESGEPTNSTKQQARHANSRRQPLGAAFCLLGAVGLLLWASAALFFPAAAQQMDASSAVTLQGSGLWALLSMAALSIGAFLLFRKQK